MAKQEIPAEAPLTFLEKLRVLAACVVAVLLLRTAGWHAAQSSDPDMAVTLILGPGGLLGAWVSLLILSAVSAAVGTAIAGRRLPEAGVFAAGIGLTALALRGGNMQDLLGYYVADSHQARAALMRVLTLDCLLWASILLVTWLAGSAAWRWLWSTPSLGAEAAADGAGQGPAGTKKQVVITRPPEAGSPLSGWPALLVTAIVGAFFVWLTIARTPVAQIARGQVIAAVAGGLFIGAMTARYFTGISDARWYALAPLAVALIGYLLGYLNVDMSWAEADGRYKYYALLATTPPHDLVRPLPVEYLAAGLAGALLGFWTSAKVEHAIE